MRPAVLARGPPVRGRRDGPRVGEVERLGPAASRQRPAAAQRASVLGAGLRPQVRLAQVQQGHYLLPQCEGFEPPPRQVEKGFHECLQSHPCMGKGNADLQVRQLFKAHGTLNR